MQIRKIKDDNTVFAVIESMEPVLVDVQSAIDLIMQAKYEAGTEYIVIPKAAVEERFFVLSSCLAGEILQKFVNYRAKLAIVGDFSHYTSKPLHDFIYECNRGKDFFFVNSIDQAIEKLKTVE